MGHGASKHAKLYTTKDDGVLYDISKKNSDPIPSINDELSQNHTRENNQNILLQIRNAISWPETFDSKQELQDLVRQLFQSATGEMTTLATEKKYSEVEEIVKAIIRLASQWGEELLASLDIKSFIREVIRINVKGIQYTINVGEYFKAQPYYTRDNRLVVFYFFHVSESITKSRIMSYYLECSNIIQRYFVLGLSVSGSHLRVCSFDRCCPSYWVVRETVLQDMKVRINARLHETNQVRQQEEDLREGIIV